VTGSKSKYRDIICKAYKISVGKPEGKQEGRPWRRCVIILKYVREICWGI
jgi:hypothetical protein